ncbi:MAG: methyltransferase domain-containing protein [Gammaproteobacteria bacterium]
MTAGEVPPRDAWYGPAHWDALYRAGRKPWDPGGVPARLDQWLSRQAAPGRALVPGCGSAWEAGRLAEAGWDVAAVDFSGEAVAEARRILGKRAHLVKLADFFALPADGGYDLVYERAFLCALPPSLRSAWRDKLLEVMAPGGVLAGFFLLGPTGHGGPPFPVPEHELDGLLQESFRRMEDAPTEASAPVFSGRERWQVWALQDAILP